MPSASLDTAGFGASRVRVLTAGESYGRVALHTMLCDHPGGSELLFAARGARIRLYLSE